ncbi:uncharacterized protein TNCV_4979941 [Trichonephila clavipes]|nr:uncharacterized protein TNCV_4979941 [Trichonephila clavipes]
MPKRKQEKKEVPEKRKFKLPKIELKKFDGNAKEYLTFWNQFKKIHEDESLPNEDKFQYLLQAVVSNSKAARVVESFPAKADSYPKAIAQQQERFGRVDLLVQIYVRDLLSMVIRNAATGRSKTDLPALYDELEAKIRALESLGQTQDKYSEFLSPLIESCLPEDILLAFERSKKFKEDTPGESRTLKLLMNFLKQEVKNNEMVELARNNFSAPINQKKKEVNTPDKFSSAVMLASTHDRNGTGPNLTEQIPDILDRFRRYPIGLSANIEKSFLQLGITPKHRDLLRFFYPDEGEEIVHRQCRMVFGVSSSPFLLVAVRTHLLENVPADDTQLGFKLKLSFYIDNCVTGE